MAWGKIWTSMDQIGMTEDEKKSICQVLAAIYHLGVAGAIKGIYNFIIKQFNKIFYKNRKCVMILHEKTIHEITVDIKPTGQITAFNNELES